MPIALKLSFVARRDRKDIRRPEDWFPPSRSIGTPSTTDMNAAIDAEFAARDINTTAPINGGGSLAADLTLTLSGTKTEFNTALEDGDFLFVGDVSSWIPVVDGSEPPVFITDGAGVLILVAGP